jgi:hypothetical protein
MALTIMQWNIQRFGINKLMNSWWDLTGRRGQYLYSTMTLPATPDIIVIIEVQTNAAAAFGGLISDTSGAPAVMAILYQLRQDFPADNWAVVPPVILTPNGGYSEGIAVLYKSAILSFWGPMMWNGVTGVAAVQNGVGAADYPGLWADALPNRISTNGRNITENQLAGQCAFFDPNGRVEFPAGNARSIWLTVFHDAASNRLLSLFSLHFPPQADNARAAFGQLTSVAELNQALVPAEDRVVLGDFNINALSAFQANVFQHLTGGPAVLPLIPVSPIVFQQLFAEGGSLKTIWDASTNNGANYYGYGGTTLAGALLGLDNIFVARQGGAPAPDGMVANRVVGTPAPPAPAVYTVDMVEDIPAIINNLPPGAPRSQRFRTLVNYGHIGGAPGASDHMPQLVHLP